MCSVSMRIDGVVASDLEDHVQSCPMRDCPLMTELLESSLYVNIIFNRDNVNGVIIYR